MEIKKIIKKIEVYENDKVAKIKEAKKYYENETKILEKGILSTSKEKVADQVLRHADNRIPHSFHQILIDEKTAYIFTYPPIIDVDDSEEINKVVNEVLGSRFNRKLKHLCVEAGNCGVAWLHYWLDVQIEEDDKGNKIPTIGAFKYEKVNTEECIAIEDNTLEKNLTEFIRFYNVIEDDTDGKEKTFRYVENWTTEDCTVYKYEFGKDKDAKIEKQFNHTFGRVPFIKFANNMIMKSDLSKYKDHIDLYDKVMSGYANDMEDIQQIIYILENYGGQDLDDFKTKLKRYKTVELESNDITGKGDLRTMQIDIPVEARKVILEELRKQIYEAGQGLDPNIESFGNASGQALKFFYRKLEIKAGNLETEFREGIAELVEAILSYKNIEHTKIEQTYTRNMISSDLELSQIAQASVGVVPTKYILQNHPWVDDVEEALKLMEEEKANKESSLEDAYPINDTHNNPKDESNSIDNKNKEVKAPENGAD